jgi:curved DNA-binding protein CbpA
MTAPAPQTVGTLARTPFGELLVRALDHRLTGTLVLEESSGARHGIYLEDGKPKQAKLASPTLHLGDVLVSSGAITSDVHERTLSRALERHVLHGQLLLGEGLINEQTLGLGLREQLARNLVSLFAQPLDTHYGYFEGTNFLAQWGAPFGHEPSMLEVLWRGLREHGRTQEIDGALERVLGLKMALRPGLPAGHFAFMGDDQETVALLAGAPRRVTELFEAAPEREASIRRVLYFLVLTRSVDLGLPSAPPVGVAAPAVVAPPSGKLPSFTSETVTVTSSTPPAPPTSSPPAPASVRRDSPPSIPPAVVRSAALREELQKRSEQPSGTHYDVLGIPRDATVPQVQSAFFLLSKRWHPDRLGPEATDLKPAAARVFAAISKAYSVLADPAARLAYDLELRSGRAPDSAPPVDRALAAELAFQKAEAFLARGNLEAAEREARAALSHDSRRAEHVALYAWLAALKPDADERRIAADLARAVRSPDAGVKVHYYRGLFLKRVGRHGAALQEFRFVCEKDPRHIDAAREVRLYEQNLRNSPKASPSLAPDQPPSSQSSTWSRLFKRRS